MVGYVLFKQIITVVNPYKYSMILKVCRKHAGVYADAMDISTNQSLSAILG